MCGSWKLSLPCTRVEAEAMPDEIAGLDPSPVLMISEVDEQRSDAWRLDAYFEGKPDGAAVAAVRALAPSSERPPTIERLPDRDWVTLSQAGLEPVRAGRFLVHAGDASPPPPGVRAFRIDAGLAFGTGQHHTTTGCLLMLDRLKRQGAVHRDILDLGTGTGLLAFAARHLWPSARVTASDIDPIAVRVAAANAELNGVRLGIAPGALALAAAPGFAHPLLIRRAPYDLIVANILAAPLIELAAEIAAALAPGGTLILAGLLTQQASAVTVAYRREGLCPAHRIDRGEWPTLAMRLRR